MKEFKKQAKMEALQNLRDAMSQMMGEDIKGGMKKVTVMSDDKKGLKEGLEKAKEMMGDMPNGESEAEEMSEMEDSPAEEQEENDFDLEKLAKMDPAKLEMIMKKIQELKK